MQLRQRMIRHEWKHVMLHVVVHVPVKEPEQRIHVHRSRIQPMVEHVLGEAEMLGATEIKLQPATVQGRKPDKHRWQDRAKAKTCDHDETIDREVDASGPVDLRPLARRQERRLLVVQTSRGVDSEFLQEENGGLEREDVEKERRDIRRTWGDDLGVAADYDRVCMVTSMAPAPDFWLPQDHETRNLVDRIVHPLGLE